MNKFIFQSLVIIFSAINSYSQITFHKAYFIDNNNQKTECFIKDKDWGINPTTIEYKLSEESEVKQIDISQMKEFAIYNSSKYIRKLVEMDRSSHVIAELNKSRNPVFKEELLFLKVLIEGKASLYQYNEAGFTRFFYKTDSSAIKQLVYTLYKTKENTVIKNEHFKQQLNIDLKCHSISEVNLKKITYDRRDLEKLFIQYNECWDSKYINYAPEKKKGIFNLNIRPGLNINNLTLGQPEATVYDYGVNTYPIFISIRFGLEIEYILPFNANKWSVIIEPVYKNFTIEDPWKTDMVAGGVLNSIVKYQSLDIPIGIRHYFHLGEKSKIFINLSYLFSFPINSTFDLTRTDGSLYNSKKIETTQNFAFGAGYKYKDKFMFEARYETNRELLKRYTNWGTEFTVFSVILGYTLF